MVLAVSHIFAFRQGGLEARKDEAQHTAALLEAEKRFTSQAQERALAAEGKLAELLAQPKAGPQVRTIVRENPSDCVVPKPVHDRVRESRSEANDAIRASLRSR